MKLIPIETPEDFSLAEQFVRPHEETCVSLASLIRRKSDKLVFISTSESSVVESVEASILGILNLDSTLYHCIPDISQIDKISLLEDLPYLLKKPVRCISGEANSTDYLIKFFPNPKQLYPYKLMRWTSPQNKVISADSTITTTLLNGR